MIIDNIGYVEQKLKCFEEEQNKETQTRLYIDSKNNCYWHAYNESQCREKIVFMRLLREICDLVKCPSIKKEGSFKVGRKPVNYSDMVYALALKSYLNFSSRRSCSDIELSKNAGDIKDSFAFTTLLKYLGKEEMGTTLKKLIEVSALPLKQIETDFAVDSSGFGNTIYSRWNDVRAKPNSMKKGFQKCHILTGVKTNIVTTVEITEGKAGDSPQFSPLVKQTSKNWNIKEVSADLAYSAKENLCLVEEIGALPFIPFKKNASGKTRGAGSHIWKTMYNYFHQNKEKFLEHYHKRSNVESTFAMIKTRFGGNVRCRRQISQKNEILLKIFCHNLIILVQELFLNEISIRFSEF